MELILVYNETNRYEFSPIMLRTTMFLLTSLYPILPINTVQRRNQFKPTLFSL